MRIVWPAAGLTCPTIFGPRIATKRRSHFSDNRSRPNLRQGSPPGRGETRSAARRGPRKSPTAYGSDARSLTCNLRLSKSNVRLALWRLCPTDPIRMHLAH